MLRSGEAKQVTTGDDERKGDDVDSGDIGSSSCRISQLEKGGQFSI